MHNITLPLEALASLVFSHKGDDNFPDVTRPVTMSPGDYGAHLAQFDLGTLIKEVDKDEEMFHVELLYYRPSVDQDGFPIRLFSLEEKDSLTDLLLAPSHAELWLAHVWRNSNTNRQRLRNGSDEMRLLFAQGQEQLAKDRTAIAAIQKQILAQAYGQKLTKEELLTLAENLLAAINNSDTSLSPLLNALKIKPELWQ